MFALEVLGELGHAAEHAQAYVTSVPNDFNRIGL